jgi:predicted SAM-dependent methyltransferase
MKKLNIGCENEYREGWVNLDVNNKVKADVYHNLNKFPYPFKKEEFDVILASHVLEHLDDVEKAMKEIYRIAKDKAIVYLEAPHFSNPFALSSQLDHKHMFSYTTFGEWHCNKELFTMFEVLKKKISFTRVNYPFLNKIFNPLINLCPLIYERFFAYILPSSTIVYILRVRKDNKFQENKIKYLKSMEAKNPIDNLEFIKKI